MINGDMIQFLAEPVSTVVSENSSVMITCPVSPPVAIVQWFYQDKAISDDNQWITVNGTSLIIDEFQVGDDTNSHEGTYYCVATTSLGALVSQPATLQLPQFSGLLQNQAT